MHNLSDEECALWVATPISCSGARVFPAKVDLDRSLLPRWRQRMGEEKLVALLQESLSVASKGAAKPADFFKVLIRGSRPYSGIVPPPCNGMMPPPDSEMMAPPRNGMIPPGVFRGGAGAAVGLIRSYLSQSPKEQSVPAERVTMPDAREIIRLKYSSVSTHEIARRLGMARSTVQETLKRTENAGLS
jgi:hypothetical protein